MVIDIDTLRADRIDAKEGDAWVMPNLRKLATRGVRFDHMISQGGWTAPALDALLSGRYPLTFSVAGGVMPKRAPDVGMIGRSLRPLLEHPEGAEGFGDRSIFSKTNANNMSLRQGMMKLILRNDAADWRPRRPSPGSADPRTAKEPWYELYDLAADPVSEKMLRRFRENGYWKIVGEDAGR